VGFYQSQPILTFPSGFQILWTMAPERLVDSLRKEISNLKRELGTTRTELEEFKLKLKMVEAAP